MCHFLLMNRVPEHQSWIQRRLLGTFPAAKTPETRPGPNSRPPTDLPPALWPPPGDRRLVGEPEGSSHNDLPPTTDLVLQSAVSVDMATRMNPV